MASVKRIFQKSQGRTLISLKNWSLQSRDSPCWSISKGSIASSYGAAENNRCLQTTKSVIGNATFKSKSKVLSQSSILIQDGLGFEELPVLIRRATKESFPFTPYSYAGSSVKEESEFDITFRQALQNCSSVNAVFKLLEIPHNQVAGYSAAFALQRLHELKKLNTEWQQIHSFIRSAVMRELYSTVESDVKLLSSETLLALVECYLAAEGFSLSCSDAINVEIQVRLADNAFTISELLLLAEILLSSTKFPRKSIQPDCNEPEALTSDFISQTLRRDFEVSKEDFVSQPVPPFDKFSEKGNTHEVQNEMKAKCQELLENVWVHLLSRYSEIDEHTLPLVLQTLSQEMRSMIPLLEKPAANVWAEMTPVGIKASLDHLSRLKVHNAGLMTHLGRWAYVHSHEMSSDLLMSYLHTFTQFHFLDDNLIKVMEKYLQIRGVQVPTDLLAMSVEYCMTCRYLSPITLEAAAAHLTQHGDTYHPLQLYAVLRAFGYLNYLPLKPANFLKKAESCLWEHFDNLEERQILEVLASLTFINVLPRNFYSRVTSAYFYTKVGALKNPEKAAALMWLRLLKHAVAEDLSMNMDKSFQWVLEQRNRRSIFLYLDQHKVAILALRQALNELFGPKFSHVLPFYGCCALYTDKDGNPLEVRKNRTRGYRVIGDIDKKLVVMIRSADHFTVNTKQLLGAQAQRMRSLNKMGFNVIEVRASQLMYFSNQSEEVMRDLLLPLVNSDAFLESQSTGDKVDNNDRDWLSYSNDEAIISDRSDDDDVD